MNQSILKTVEFVKETLQGAEAGHDWFHTERVWKTARTIQQAEGGNPLVIELGALLHDIADPKFHNGDEALALSLAGDFLQTLPVHKEASQVLFIIKHISFKNSAEVPANPPLELQIVQDADRLDALGAIGIARAFHFGGYKNNPLHHPDIPPNLNQSKEEYKKSRSTTINHFYEKLLLLKDLMNTPTAQEMAQERHNFILSFLQQFHREWQSEEL